MHLFFMIFFSGALALIILTIGFTNDSQNRNYSMKITKMQEYGQKIADTILTTGYYTEGNRDIIHAELGLIADIGYGRILITDDKLDVIYDTYQRDTGKALISERLLKTIKGSSHSIVRNGIYVELIIPVYHIETKVSYGAVILNFSMHDEYDLVREQQNNNFIMLTAVLIVLLIAALLYADKISSPLKNIVRYMKHVSEGSLEENMKILGYKETRQIAKAHNEMLDFVRRLENSRQEFVSNVSHELKTPMTSMKVLADSLLLQEAPVELYREFMTDINEEIERENKIINDLLSLVKLDKNTEDMHIASININDLLELILKRLKPIAQLRNIELVYESFRPVSAEVDEVKISLAVSNLIENAIKYNTEDGWVRISLNADHKYFFIRISDSGIGISEEDQKLIFDRFYRVDKARSRETGGTGLGLAITKKLILMHNGSIKVSSIENEGSTFTIRIPLNYIL